MENLYIKHAIHCANRVEGERESGGGVGVEVLFSEVEAKKEVVMLLKSRGREVSVLQTECAASLLLLL